MSKSLDGVSHEGNNMPTTEKRIRHYMIRIYPQPNDASDRYFMPSLV